MDNQFLKYGILIVSILVLVYLVYRDYKRKKIPVTSEATTYTKNKTGLSRKRKMILIVLGVVAVIVALYFRGKELDKVEIPLSEAITLSQGNSFSSMEIESDSLIDTTLTLTLANDINDVVDVDDEIVQLKTDDEIEVSIGELTINDLTEMGFVLPSKYQQVSNGYNWGNLTTAIVQSIFLIFLLYYMMGGAMFGSTGNKFKATDTKVTFADIGGMTEAKQSVMEVVEFIKGRGNFSRLGAKVPKGILLDGLPGTGKTMLAQAIANEAGIPFYYISGSEFHSMWAGMAATRVRSLFKKVRKTSGVIFIDEFDSVGGKRSFETHVVQREFDHTVTQLLSEMDGFKESDNVFVLAATNRSDILDPAIVRAGRFDRKITVPLPNLEDRIEILKIHSKNKVLDNAIDYRDVAKQTTGFSGADLALLMNESAILATKKHQDKIDMSCINDAVDKVLAGEERKNISITSDEKKLIAYHEAGHALVAEVLPQCDKVQRVTILPHGNSGGFTRLSSEKDQILLSKAKALNMISMMLAGRVAEEIMVGDISSSAQNDIAKANELVHQMVESYGMGENYKLNCITKNQLGTKDISPETYKIIDEDVNDILGRCYKIAEQVLQENKDKLSKIADKLLEVEVLNANELRELLK